MPGVFRMGVDTMMTELERLVPIGLKSVLLFAVTRDQYYKTLDVRNLQVFIIS
jgi:delta-aminolevulinic acid dehydratase/porphobilinogen synthase